MRRRRQMPSRSLQAPSRSTSGHKLFNTSRSVHPDTCLSSPASSAVRPSFSASHSLPTRSCSTSRYCVSSAAQPAQRTPCPHSVTALIPWPERRRYRAVVGTRPAPRGLPKRTEHQHRLPTTFRHQLADQRREAGIAAERHTCGHPRSTVSLRHPPEPPSTHPTQRIGTTGGQPNSVSVEAKLPARPQNPLPVRFAFDDHLVGHSGRKVFQ